MTTNITGNITGIPKLLEDLANLGTNGLMAVGMAIHEEGEAIMRKSKEPQWVPRKNSILANTGFVDPPVFTGLGITVRLHYGGGAARDYAVIQHENLEFNHPKGGHAKYLEGPFLEAQAGISERIALRASQLIL